MATVTQDLHRALGFRDVLLYFVTTGTNLQWVAVAAAAGASSLVIWVIGALIMFMPLAVCVVYLAARYPEHGGLYVWCKRAFGPFTGFMTGWTYWTSNLPYFPGLLYFAAGNALFLMGGGHETVAAAGASYYIVFSLAGLGLATYLNLNGLELAKWLNNIGAIARSAATILLIAVGLVIWWRFGSATEISSRTIWPHLDLSQLIFWSTIAFAMTGPESASFMSGEIRDSNRTIPRALVTSAPLILAIYVLGTIGVLAIVPSSETNALYGVMEAISRAAHRLALDWLVPVGGFIVTVSCLGSVGAWLGSVARIPFVAGIDSYLPPAFARLHPRHGTPTVALVTQSLIAAFFIFLGQAGTTVKGAYDVLVSMLVITVMLPFVPLFASAIKLAVKEGSQGPWSSLAIRSIVVVMAIVGILTTLASMVLAAWPRPDEPNQALAVAKVIGGTAMLVGTGVVVYAAGLRRARQSNGNA